MGLYSLYIIYSRKNQPVFRTHAFQADFIKKDSSVHRTFSLKYFKMYPYKAMLFFGLTPFGFIVFIKESIAHRNISPLINLFL